METITSKRSPTRCREWERQRRNKFNDAITKLGEIVIAINKAKNLIGSENVQYTKVEIVQKAILCLTDCAHEQTQLKAEILALQVELQSVKSKKLYKDASYQVSIEINKQDIATQVTLNKKDASIQVSLGPNKRSRNGKYIKVKMLQKSKRNALKEKPIVTNVATKLQNTKPVIKEQKIYPKITLENEKAPENTIVVLPAAPYIFPQRPLLLPPMPPTIVLVNPNMQSVNRHPVQIIGRNNGDITKTTMVNILPISAYSRPLSAAKNKKNTLKLKNDCGKKVIKKSKVSEKIVKESPKANVSLKPVDEPHTETKVINDINNKCELNHGEKSLEKNEKNTQDVLNAINKVTQNEQVVESIVSNESKITKTDESISEKNEKSKSEKIKHDTPKFTEPNLPITVPSTSSTISMITLMTSMNDSNDEGTKINKSTKEKGCLIVDKDKENKLPTILDPALCDGNVEGGNARLELAEEFLAASPTAAFLMSFPLVSGNRADSPAEEQQSGPQTTKDTIQPSTPKRNEVVNQSNQYFEKPDVNELKIKCSIKNASSSATKQTEQQKYAAQTPIRDVQSKPINTKTTSNVSIDNPFLNLPMPSLISTNCPTTDTTFGLEFDCNMNKTLPSQSTSFVSNGNLFYKSDPFSTVKNNIYSSSNITSSHDFNSLGLYPCAMEKYTTKNKSDFTNVEDNIMKMGPSRLTYDIDLGWSHKSFDFVTCTTSSNTFNKDILTPVSAPYSTTYNPFNPEFHVPLVSNTNKKENATNKPVTFAESFSGFYSQSNLWAEDVPFYTSSSGSKTLTKQNYLPLEHAQTNVNVKHNETKSYDSKQIVNTVSNTGSKSTNMNIQMSEKYTKKSPSKMHINWMTSEIRPLQSNCTTIHCEPKDVHKATFNHSDPKSSYNNIDNTTKKPEHESNYFPINMHNFSTQTVQEDFQIWPPARPLGTTEISIEPPPMNLPTLVGDLALGPHDKKKNLDVVNRALPQPEINNCGNFLSVTQLMNRSTDNMHSRYQPSNVETSKTTHKENILHFTNENNRKVMNSRPENNLAQSCYGLNDAKLAHPYESNMTHYSHSKAKTNKPEKNSKSHKNNYSAEALIRGGGTCNQKLQDPSSAKFIMPTQKYNDFNSTQDSSIAQVSHFPPIIDYSDNSYAGQQFSGTTLYNATTNTISNSFYSNFMPGGGNLMSSNYASGAFTSDFIDYNQATECSYTNHKYEELKMKNNLTYHQDKLPPNYKSSRRESATKHKLECSKKDSKKYQSKRAKPNPEVEDWNDPSHLLWQNKTTNKRHSNITAEEMPFPNYVGNQMSTQYQPEFFNSHLMPSNMQSVSHNVDRTISTFPVTSRANFNLSTIFPEIAMKVQ